MSEKSISLTLENFTCSSCVGDIEGGLKKVSGIHAIEVDAVRSQVTVSFDENKITRDKIIKALSEMGYPPTVIDDQKGSQHMPEKSPFFQYVALFITIVAALILIVEMGFAMLGKMGMPLWVEFGLSLLAQVIGGYSFYKNAYMGLKQRRANMDTLVALSTTVAFLYSAVVFLFNLSQHYFFETNATILAFILLGRTIEDYVKRSAKSEMVGLLKLQPKFAFRLGESGEREKVSVYDVHEEDVLQVLPSEQIPVDGIVVEGESGVDEKLFTGEALEVPKKPGDKVIGGSLNGASVLTIKCTAKGKESLLGRMIDLVEKTNRYKPAAQRLADTIASIFVPIVLAISVVTFFVWGLAIGSFKMGTISAVAVLIIACPCALGMATPLVIMMTSYRASKRGLLIKDFSAFESLHKVKMIAFDKTGTVTTGAFRLISAPEDSQAEKLARIIASHSHHPLSQKIADPEGKAKSVSEFPGKGVMGQVDDHSIVIGSVKFLSEQGIEVNDAGEQGSAIYVGVDKSYKGAFIFEDERRDGVEETFKQLQKSGYKTALLSGDRAKVVHTLAEELGISEYRSELLPEDKAEFIAKQKKGIAMVGDGVNDAIALSKATVGIAMASSADVAMEAADVGIMNGNFTVISDLMQLSKSAHQRIIVNLSLAFFYNIVAIPVAFLGLLNPIIASIAMALSSVSVVVVSVWRGK